MSGVQDEIFQNVTGDMDFFKKILSKVPGFKGYVDRQSRRDSDKLLREMVFNRFRELEGRVSSLQREFISHGEIQYVDDLEASAIKLRTFADRIRTATRGYSSLFEATKIGSEELSKIYQYDAAFLDSVDEIDRAIDNVQGSVGTDGLPASMRNLESVIAQCIVAFDRREEIVIAG